MRQVKRDPDKFKALKAKFDAYYAKQANPRKGRKPLDPKMKASIASTKQTLTLVKKPSKDIEPDP